MDIATINCIAERICEARGWSKPEFIDNGASAAVYKVDIGHRLAALKVYDPQLFEGENAPIEENRIALQMRIRGHGCSELIDILDADKSEADRTWYLLMEFCPWKSLSESLVEVPDGKVHHLIRMLVTAVQHLASLGLVHRDIKPANIIVSHDFEELKLLDFGVLRNISQEDGSGTDGYKFIATVQYSPPEFLTREEEVGASGFSAINIYQVGAVLHDLIMKRPLFAEEASTKNKYRLSKAVAEQRPKVSSASLPPKLIALCKAALQKDPLVRTNAVSLDDFASTDDDLEAIRRRISGGGFPQKRISAPTLTEWKSRVRSWAKSAAELEKETLGAVAIKAAEIPSGIRWELTFAVTQIPIFIDLLIEGDTLAGYVESALPATHNEVILRISVDGPDVPENVIPVTLANAFVYASEAALTINENKCDEGCTS